MNEFLLLMEKSEKFLKSAQTLIEIEDYESATSRNYYAMFCAVQAILETKEVSVKTHTGAINKFSQLFIKTEIFDKSLSKDLSEAFEIRTASDYEIYGDISKEYAQELLKKGNNFVNMIKSYLIENQFIM